LNKCFSKKTVRVQVAIIGAGPCGIAAALAAARGGKTVALITDRSVLGGNASSEIRVNPLGASYAPWNRYARETGIIEEISNLAVYRASKNGEWSWYDLDAAYFDLVFAEKNITLELNTYISAAEKNGVAIVAVEGNQSRGETVIRVEADIFIDASGDGTVGFLAGCDFRTGAESRYEFKEFYGPENAEKGTMGTTLLFTSKNTGRRTEFKTPDWAIPFDWMNSAYRIAHSVFPSVDGNYGGFWWLEHGGDADTICDDNDISLHLRKAVYGLWGFIKNSGLYPESECHALDWIGYLGGKRESRRLAGCHTVNSAEIMRQEDYFDNIGYAGWPIDVHPSDGYKSVTCGCTHYWLPGPANMPARMLISKDVPNLLFAGRCASATHEALGTLRLIRTTAVMGQAAGTIAALSISRAQSPIDLVNCDYGAIERRLLKDDQRINGRALFLENDAAKKAAVSVSSEHCGSPVRGEAFKYADKSIGLVVPCRSLEYLELLLSSDAEVDVAVDFYSADGNAVNYRIKELVSGAVARVKDKKWYKFAADIKNAGGGKVFALIRRMPPVRVWGENENYGGFVSFTVDGDELKYDSFFNVLNADSNMPYTVCCKYSDAALNYAKENLTDGHIAPYAAPKMWMSAQIGIGGETIEFDFGKKIEFKEIELVFNSNLNSKSFIPVMNKVAPETVKKYAVYCVNGGKEELYFADDDNFRRFVRIAKPASAEKVIIRMYETHGSRYAQVFDVRINTREHRVI
jgi:hypothetical protein